MLENLTLYLGKIKTAIFNKKDNYPVTDITTFGGISENNVKTSHLIQPHGYFGTPCLNDDCILYKGDNIGYSNYILGSFTYILASAKIQCKNGENGIYSRSSNYNENTQSYPIRYAFITKENSVGVYWDYTSTVVADKQVQYSTIAKGEETQQILLDILNELIADNNSIKKTLNDLVQLHNAHTHVVQGVAGGTNNPTSNAVSTQATPYAPSSIIERDQQYVLNDKLLINDNGSDLLG